MTSTITTCAPRKLIVSTGDISDVDGFIALARYAQTGCDALFIMNYPAYIGVQNANPEFHAKNPGLGYLYNSAEVLTPLTKEGKYKEFLSKFPADDQNQCMKLALTNMAFTLATQVWNEQSPKGKLLFQIGGINSTNPFSPTAIKNEIMVYWEHYARCSTGVTLGAEEGTMYDTNGLPTELPWATYNNIFMDFNGSMAFWNDSWEDGRLKNLSAVFIMGGVYSDVAPTTMPAIANSLNRFSCATMNQIYHPKKTAAFFDFVAKEKIQAFIVPNNAVLALKDAAAMKTFIESNGVAGDFLLAIANAY